MTAQIDTVSTDDSPFPFDRESDTRYQAVEGVCPACGIENVLTSEGICLHCYDKRHNLDEQGRSLGGEPTIAEQEGYAFDDTWDDPDWIVWDWEL